MIKNKQMTMSLAKFKYMKYKKTASLFFLFLHDQMPIDPFVYCHYFMIQIY